MSIIRRFVADVFPPSSTSANQSIDDDRTLVAVSSRCCRPFKMATPDEASFISFVAPSTLIDPAFWEELYQKKLNIYKLGTETEQITALYNCSGSRNSESFMLDGLSFAKSTEAITLSTGRLSANGALINVNTIEVRSKQSMRFQCLIQRHNLIKKSSQLVLRIIRKLLLKYQST